MAVRTVTRRAVANQVGELLESPELAALISELEALRWTGRKGYSVRSLVGACLVKSLYAIPTWSRTAALISEHAALREALGDAPSVYALYRFAEKLRRHQPMLDTCLDSVVASIGAELPDYGIDLAIDGSDMTAYANGQRFVSKDGPERERYSDPDASWGHRSAVSTRKGGGFYGYKLSAAVCARTDLPVAWLVGTARQHESGLADDLLQRVRERVNPETVSLDKGYDVPAVYDACERAGTVPIIPLRNTPAVKANPRGHIPTCDHGEWVFAGADFKRRAAKWRCPTGECKPASTWITAGRRNPLIPRETKRWSTLYRGRAAVEREFGRLKHEYGLSPLRVRGLDRSPCTPTS